MEAVVFRGREEIERAWVQTYHETGRLINGHILQNRDRAGYGAKVFEKLSADTGISKRTLHECAQFHRCFPIVRTSAQLSRSHYVVLCQVADETQRATLLRDTLKQKWSVAELVARIRPLNAALAAREAAEAGGAEGAPAAGQRLLAPQRGTAGIFRVVARGAGVAVDLGFKLYVEADAEEGLAAGPATDLRAGDFVTFDGRGRPAQAAGAGKGDLFTYAATVRRVVDGDTLAIEVHLPRGYVHEMKLRLRALDCPEMDTAEGKAAKRFAEGLVWPATAVTIHTTKPDKYDRYLADVFLTQPDGREVFLNNELLARGHAVRKDVWTAADWEG